MSRHSTTPETSTPQVASTPRAGFRADIQGLRAIAVAVVVLYHFWPHRLPGGFIGVDVFFVISGFLITGHLMNKPPRHVGDILGFWMRRVKRLLPASFVVILATLTGIWALAPTTVWKDWGLQALASTFYFQNWFLASSKVDYLAEADAPSPFQHFWSLSVEEQFYLVWPVLIGVLVLLGVRSGRRPALAVGAGIGVLFAGSLAYSVYATAQSAGIAYFSTFTRAWEFAAGALVAVLGAKACAPKGGLLPAMGAWLGLVAIAGSAVGFNAELPFPGAVALVPVIGTMLVLWTHATGRYSPLCLLSHPVMRFTGDHSYAIYLWHWPVLILAPFVLQDFFAVHKLIALAGIVLLAVATQKLVETRFRRYMERSRIVTAPRFLLAGSLALAVLGGNFYTVSQQLTEESKDIQAGIERVKDEVGIECFGAASLANDCQDTETSFDTLAPAPVVAKEDRPPVYEDDCFAEAESEFSTRTVCQYGTGDTKVALVGNSHAGHWVPALEPVARDNDWQIDTYVASACAPMGLAQEFDNPQQEEGCAEFGQWAAEEIAEGGYDLVISSNRQSKSVVGYNRADSAAPAEDAYARILEAWADSGAEIVVLRDTPWPGTTLDNVPDCVAENPDDLSLCTGSAEDWVPMDPQYDAAQAMEDPRITAVDVNDYFCQDGTCHSVIGGVLAYYDHSHLSRTFAQSMSAPLEQRLRDAVDSARLWN